MARSSRRGISPDRFYEVCRRKRVDASLFVDATRTHARTYTLETQDVFALGEQIAAGANGRVFAGTFGAGVLGRPVAIKMNKRGDAAEDAAEVKMQADLFCAFREGAFRVQRELRELAPRMAKIPQPLFAAHTADGRAIGMESLDGTLVEYLHARRDDAKVLVDALRQVAALLHFLQTALHFVHGDLHGQNVMMRGSHVFLIDFGMSSYGVRTRRTHTHRRYVGVDFNSCLDLLMLVSFLREWSGRMRDTRHAVLCDRVVRPFWDALLRDGDRARFHTQKLATNARPWAHHILYERAADVRYARTRPLGLLRYLAKVSFAPATPREESMDLASLFVV